MSLTPDEIRAAAAEIVERTCKEQGLPPKITDRATLERIAVLLRASRSDASANRKSAA